MVHKKIIYIIAFFIGSIVFVFAADTIIQEIRGSQSSTGVSGYTSQKTQTINKGDLKFINKDGDDNILGDYFMGKYYDSAYGVFEISRGASSRLRIASELNTTQSNTICGGVHQGYKLEGFAHNPEFGNIDFSHTETPGVYICIPKDSTNISMKSYLTGHAYSPYIGFQNFDGIALDVSIDIRDDVEGTQLADGGFIKVDGSVSTKNEKEIIDDQFEGNVRIIGNLTKSSFRKDIQKKVYASIKGLTSSTTGDQSVSGVGNINWTTGGGAVSFLKNKALYYKSTSGGNIEIGTGSVVGNKTLIVEGGNVYIRGNITGNGTLGIIVLKSGTNGGNIYIHPSVTDIHAVMYADTSIMSYNGSELGGATPDASLANQLYIYGSIFSENTLGGGVGPNFSCPYYINAGCDENTAKKYDFNFIRRYKLVSQIDADGNVISMTPQYGAKKSLMGGGSGTPKPGYDRYPFIIEYNSSIQKTPPPFFE